MIETERLRVYPATREQMEAVIAAEIDEGLKAAYTEMLAGCLRHPEQWAWYAMWMIERRDGTHVGDLCFKGFTSNNTAEIGYGILDSYQGLGYASEAVSAAVAWAFQNPELQAVEAETDPENTASQRVLKKCGFTATGETGEEGPRFAKTRPMLI